ncbi:DUF6356 family protein [Jannaschia sp. LMIT008]|uniref:DUF6356 family protein n=1 Tax=Jannaschia maritima TaxID=3032585 RepID=UPI002810D5E0|nr:DUF6356 family protein [Jannaschia sp. LMIT008]
MPSDTTDPHAPARPTAFLRGFRDHPASVGESYGQHARFALGFAGQLALAAGAALVHAAIPPLFETTASRIVRRLHARIEARH